MAEGTHSERAEYDQSFLENLRKMQKLVEETLKKMDDRMRQYEELRRNSFLSANFDEGVEEPSANNNNELECFTQSEDRCNIFGDSVDSIGRGTADFELDRFDESQSHLDKMHRDLPQTPAGDGKQATESDGNDQTDSEEASRADGSSKFGNLADFTHGDISDAESHSEEDDTVTNSSTEKITVAKSISAQKREVDCDEQGYDFQISPDLDIFVIPTELQMDGNRAEVLHTLYFNLSCASSVQYSFYAISDNSELWKQDEGKSMFSFINDNKFYSHQMIVGIILIFDPGIRRQLIGLLETHTVIIKFANIDYKCEDFTFSSDSEVVEITRLNGSVIICVCCEEQITDDGMVVCIIHEIHIIVIKFSSYNDFGCESSITKDNCCEFVLPHLDEPFVIGATNWYGLIGVESRKRMINCVMTYLSHLGDDCCIVWPQLDGQCRFKTFYGPCLLQTQESMNISGIIFALLIFECLTVMEMHCESLTKNREEKDGEAMETVRPTEVYVAFGLKLIIYGYFVRRGDGRITILYLVAMRNNFAKNFSIVVAILKGFERKHGLNVYCTAFVSNTFAVMAYHLDLGNDVVIKGYSLKVVVAYMYGVSKKGIDTVKFVSYPFDPGGSMKYSTWVCHL